MKISIKELTDGINAKAHRKENHFFKGLKIVSFNTETKEFSEPIDVRWYGTQAVTYCCIWGTIKGVHFNGSGKAGGYGYDRSSAAFSEALESAGFEVVGLSGTGQNELAVEKLAQLNELENYTIVRVHG